MVISLADEPGLVGAVRSLLAQGPEVEVVVVNSGGGDPAATLSKAGIEVPLMNVERRLNPGGVRNIGIRSTSGTYVAFLAADCTAEPDWVAERLRHHRNGASAVASAVVNANPESAIAEASYLLTRHRRMPGVAAPLLFGASYDRRLFERFGMFREDMPAGEDTELRNRLDGQIETVWAPGVRAAHPHPDRIWPFLVEHFRRGRRYARAQEQFRGGPVRRSLAKRSLTKWIRVARVGWDASGPRARVRRFRAWPFLPLGALAEGVGALSTPTGSLPARGGTLAIRGQRQAARVRRWLSRATVPSAGFLPARRRVRLIALVQTRNEMRYLPGFLDNIAPQVDGVIALDDGSTDGSAEYLDAHPAVIEVMRNPPDRPAWQEVENNRLLVGAALRRGADWIICLDADERIEHRFRDRTERVIRRGGRLGHEAYALRLRELWGSSRTYRVDGHYGEARRARLFRARSDHEFDDRRLHGQKAPLQARRHLGFFPRADLDLYHLRMIHREDREARRRRHEERDPDRRWQPRGYAHLTDETGLCLVRIRAGWRRASWIRRRVLPR